MPPDAALKSPPLVQCTSPPSARSLSRPTLPPALAQHAAPVSKDYVDEDDEDDDDIESLLYLAQMDLISHRMSDAERRLERAAGLGSTGACATLAGLLARRARTASPRQPLVPSGLPVTPASSVSPPTPANARRPTMPTRQSSFNVAHSAPSRTPDALRAVDFSLRGLELLLQKPVRPSRNVEEADVDDEDSAEGRFFDLERALDLIARPTDAHRFGVLHAPGPVLEPSPAPLADDSAVNDSLWQRSALAAIHLLEHETLIELFNRPIEISPSPSLSRSLSRRSSSVSRSFAHPSSTLPLGSDTKGAAASLLGPERKLKVTVAIHALYVLALQAWAMQPSSGGLPDPPIIAPSITGSAESHPKARAERYWTLINDLAAPYTALCGIGIKEGDEIVQSTQRRLESLRHQDLGAYEPWRLAKKRGRQSVPSPSAAGLSPGDAGVPASSPTDDAGSSGVTIRPRLGQQRSGSSGSFGGPTPRTTGAVFHFGVDVEEADEEEDATRSNTLPLAMPSLSKRIQSTNLQSPPFPLSQSYNPALSSSSASASPLGREDLSAAQQYPSPPKTPPISSDARNLYPDEITDPPDVSSLSPPTSSSHLQPLVAPHAASLGLPRVSSARSIASNRSTASVLSHFKHDPLQAYLAGRLRRVTSSASVCTAPPDFSGQTRIYRGKGKGKMVEPEPSELYGKAGMTPFSPPAGRARRRSSVAAGLATVEEASLQPKTWLSRFWKASKPSLDHRFGLAGSDEDNSLERTRSSSAVDALRQALVHDQANRTHIMYWGDNEFMDEEEVNDIGRMSDEDERKMSIPARTDETDSLAPPATTASTLRLDKTPLSQADKLRSSLGAKQESATRALMPQRSFLLTDPTSSSASASVSRRGSRERTQSRRARSRQSSVAPSSASSTHSITSDGHLAPPSPRKSSRRRRRHSAVALGADGTTPREIKPVPMDPLLLELERRSHIGLKTACAACGRRGLNFPACRTCKGTYCSRDCRVGPQHVCSKAGMAKTPGPPAATAGEAVKAAAC